MIICSVHGAFEQRANHHLQGGICPACSANAVATTEEFCVKAKLVHESKYNYSKVEYINRSTRVVITYPIHGDFEQRPRNHLQGSGCPGCAKHGFDQTKSAYLYYLKITTEDNQILYKIGITNRTVDERFGLAELSKIEIVKQKYYENGLDALEWETKLKRQFKEHQYTGPDVLESGNTELFIIDIIALYETYT